MTKEKAKKEHLGVKLQDKLNKNEDFLQSLLSKSENGKLTFNLKETDVIVNEVLDSIIELTDEFDELALHGFGIFKAVRREQRKGRNPQTGKEILIKAKRVPKFEPKKVFKDVIAK